MSNVRWRSLGQQNLGLVVLMVNALVSLLVGDSTDSIEIVVSLLQLLPLPSAILNQLTCVTQAVWRIVKPCERIPNLCERIPNLCKRITNLCERITKPCERITKLCERITKPCERIPNLCERIPKPCERITKPCERITNLCERIPNLCERITKPCERITKPCKRCTNPCARITTLIFLNKASSEMGKFTSWGHTKHFQFMSQPRDAKQSSSL